MDIKDPAFRAYTYDEIAEENFKKQSKIKPKK
jgi:hypothetical protein